MSLLWSLNKFQLDFEQVNIDLVHFLKLYRFISGGIEVN